VLAERADDLRVRLEVTLEGEDPDRPRHRRRYQPRGESNCSDSSFELSRLTIA
jgi:hypothetical protein